MRAAAIEGETLSYTQLTHRITALSYKPYDEALSQLLCEISRRTNHLGLGLLSAVVIHADGDRLPGDGFFSLATELGRDVTDRTACWKREVSTVFKTAHQLPQS